jgi:hypothetical protein
VSNDGKQIPVYSLPARFGLDPPLSNLEDVSPGIRFRWGRAGIDPIDFIHQGQVETGESHFLGHGQRKMD